MSERARAVLPRYYVHRLGRSDDSAAQLYRWPDPRTMVQVWAGDHWAAANPAVLVSIDRSLPFGPTEDAEWREVTATDIEALKSVASVPTQAQLERWTATDLGPGSGWTAYSPRLVPLPNDRPEHDLDLSSNADQDGDRFLHSDDPASDEWVVDHFRHHLGCTYILHAQPERNLLFPGFRLTARRNAWHLPDHHCYSVIRTRTEDHTIGSCSHVTADFGWDRDRALRRPGIVVFEDSDNEGTSSYRAVELLDDGSLSISGRDYGSSVTTGFDEYEFERRLSPEDTLVLHRALSNPPPEDLLAHLRKRFVSTAALESYLAERGLTGSFWNRIGD